MSRDKKEPEGRRTDQPPGDPAEGKAEGEAEGEAEAGRDATAGAQGAPEGKRRGLRRSRPISVIPEVADVERASEKRRRFFTRPVSGDSGVQSASAVRRRWRWFRPSSSRTEERPPSDMSDTEARAEAARSAAAELRTRLEEGARARPKPKLTSPFGVRRSGSLATERPPTPTGPLPPVSHGTSADASAAADAAAAAARADAAATAAPTFGATPPGAAASGGKPPGTAGASADASGRGPRADTTPVARPRAASHPPSPEAPQVTWKEPASGAGVPARPRAASASGAGAPARPRAASASGATRSPRPSSQDAATAAAGTAEPRRARGPAGLRLWRRPLTELSRPAAWHRHDLLVVGVALALFATGVTAQRRLAAPSLRPLDQLGLHIASPAGWLPPRRVGRPTGGLVARTDARDGRAPDAAAPSAPGLPYHIQIQSALDPAARLELRIAQRPTTGNLRSALVLERVSRHGEALWAADSVDRTIGGRDWVRTAYRYAYKGSKTDAPRIATGIEYATINGRLLYAVTLHGRTDAAARRLESLLVPTLAVDANHPAAVGVR